MPRRSSKRARTASSSEPRRSPATDCSRSSSRSWASDSSWRRRPRRCRRRRRLDTGDVALGRRCRRACRAGGRDRLLCTAIERDGTLDGPSLELLGERVRSLPPPRPRRRRNPLVGRPRDSRRNRLRGCDRRPRAPRRARSAHCTRVEKRRVESPRDRRALALHPDRRPRSPCATRGTTWGSRTRRREAPPRRFEGQAVGAPGAALRRGHTERPGRAPGLDASGKDGVIRAVFTGVNPLASAPPRSECRPRPSALTTTCGASTQRFRRVARSASSTARTTRTSSPCACTHWLQKTSGVDARPHPPWEACSSTRARRSSRCSSTCRGGAAAALPGAHRRSREALEVP